MNLRILAAAVLALVLAAPSPARAVSISEQTYSRGEHFGARLVTEDGKPFGKTFQLFEPGSTKPFREGRLPADGWVRFIPERAGTWYVRITDEAGQGKLVPLDVSTAFTPSEVAAAPAPTPPQAPPLPGSGRGPRILGAVLVLAVLAALVGLRVVRRRRAAQV